MTTTEAAAAIKLLDGDIKLSATTMKAAPAADRPHWKGLIDRLLDRRLELMRRAKTSTH